MARPPAQGRGPAPRGRARGPLARDARHGPGHRGPRLRLGLGRRAPPVPLAPTGRRAGRGRRGRSLAAIAAVTSRVEFGPLVACTNFHNPALLAKQAVDHRRDQRRPADPRPGRRLERDRVPGLRLPVRPPRSIAFEEAFTIIRTLLRDGAIDFDGQFYQARDCELLPPRPAARRAAADGRLHRPAHAADHPAARRRRGTCGSPTPATRPRAYRRLREMVDEACRDVGRDPAAIERTVAVQVRLPGGQGRIQGDYAKAAPAAARGRSPEHMADVLRAYAREGIGHVQLVIDPIDRASIEAFAPVLGISTADRRWPARIGTSVWVGTAANRCYARCPWPIPLFGGLRPGVALPVTLVLAGILAAACSEPPVVPSRRPRRRPSSTPNPHLADPATARMCSTAWAARASASPRTPPRRLRRGTRRHADQRHLPGLAARRDPVPDRRRPRQGRPSGRPAKRRDAANRRSPSPARTSWSSWGPSEIGSKPPTPDRRKAAALEALVKALDRLLSPLRGADRRAGPGRLGARSRRPAPSAAPKATPAP